MCETRSIIFSKDAEHDIEQFDWQHEPREVVERLLSMDPALTVRSTMKVPMLLLDVIDGEIDGTTYRVIVHAPAPETGLETVVKSVTPFRQQ